MSNYTSRWYHTTIKTDYCCCCTGTVHCRYCERSKRPPHLTVDKDYNTVLINELNEINKMNELPVNTHEEFKAAIISHKYIVGSVDYTGNLSFSCNPRTHESRALARAECNRLAKLSPGKMYVFVRFEGAELLPRLVATESI